jgi:hypothetical protein
MSPSSPERKFPARGVNRAIAGLQERNGGFGNYVIVR